MKNRRAAAGELSETYHETCDALIELTYERSSENEVINKLMHQLVELLRKPDGDDGPSDFHWFTDERREAFTCVMDDLDALPPWDQMKLLEPHELRRLVIYVMAIGLLYGDDYCRRIEASIRFEKGQRAAAARQEFERRLERQRVEVARVERLEEAIQRASNRCTQCALRQISRG